MQASLQSIFFDILLHEIDQVGDGEKDDTDPLHDRGYLKADGEMRFSNSRWTKSTKCFLHEPQTEPSPVHGSAPH